MFFHHKHPLEACPSEKCQHSEPVASMLVHETYLDKAKRLMFEIFEDDEYASKVCVIFCFSKTGRHLAISSEFLFCEIGTRTYTVAKF